MIGLGRKSIAQKIFEELDGTKEGKGTWLVMYDFKRKPNPRFWGNLGRVIRLTGDGELIQHSVYQTRNRKGALVAAKIAEHYGADVILFNGEFVDIS